MRILYYDSQERPYSFFKHKIFLAGPTPRSNSVKSWRPEAIDILNKLEYQGDVFVPEYSSSKIKNKLDRLEIYEWEKIRLDESNVIAMWLPRSIDLLGFTSNIEFGRYVGSQKLFFGHPENAWKCGYMDWMYEDTTGRKPLNNLYDLLVKVCFTYRNI